MSADAFAAQVRAARLRHYEPEEGVRLSYELPSTFRIGRLLDAMRAGDGDAIIELMVPQFSAWSGVTRTMLTGDGSSDAAPLGPDAARALLADRATWVIGLAQHAVSESNEAYKRTQATAGN